MKAVSRFRRVARWARNLAYRASSRDSDSSGQAMARLKSYGAKAAACGLDRLHLFLSFDCDTDLDFEAVMPLDAFLRERGIVPTYAVPGAQLMRGRDIYAAIAASGREFMNHGGRAHAAWKVDQYVPITFYEKMASDDVIADIEEGHRIVVDVTGQSPSGFRAPHFGCFQRDQDLGLIHRTIKRLGYSYSSTTVPDKALENGPIYRADNVVEIPVFGSARHPHLILDTWTQLTDRRCYALGESYYELFAETIDVLTRNNIPALLTWYGDPSHAWQQAPFMNAMDLIAKHAIPSLSGREVASLCSDADASSVPATS